MTSSRYTLPEVLNPPDDFCAKVYIPNDPTYRRAFLGSYTFFGMWVAWERDRNHSAAIAAARWRESVEKTLDLWGMGCGSGDDMTDEEFREIIRQELEDMSIIINNTNSCGCCGSSGSGVSIGGGVEPPDGYTTPLIEPIEPVDTVQNVEKCNRSTYLMVAFRNACLGVAEKIQGPFQDVMDYFMGAFLGLSVYDGFDYDDYLRIRTWVSGAERDTFNRFLTAYDQNFDAMVCAVYSAATAGEAKAAVRDILNEFVWSQLDIFPRTVFKAMWEIVKMEYIFDLDYPANLPPGFENRQCCGQIPVDALLYLWVPSYSGDVTAYPDDGVLTTYAEDLNNQTSVDCQLSLKRTAQYDYYRFKLVRQCVAADMTTFAINIRQNGNLGEWKVTLRSESGNLASMQGTGSDITLDFTSLLNPALVSNISNIWVERVDEVYAAASPRAFNMEFDITTDSEDFMLWDYT